MLGVLVAALFWFLWTLLGPVHTNSDEIDRLRRQTRTEQVQINDLKQALAQANADRAVENKPPIVIAPTGSPTTAPALPPTTAANQKHCTVPDLINGGCLVK